MPNAPAHRPAVSLPSLHHFCKFQHTDVKIVHYIIEIVHFTLEYCCNTSVPQLISCSFLHLQYQSYRYFLLKSLLKCIWIESHKVDRLVVFVASFFTYKNLEGPLTAEQAVFCFMPHHCNTECYVARTSPKTWWDVSHRRGMTFPVKNPNFDSKKQICAGGKICAGGD